MITSHRLLCGSIYCNAFVVRGSDMTCLLNNGDPTAIWPLQQQYQTFTAYIRGEVDLLCFFPLKSACSALVRFRVVAAVKLLAIPLLHCAERTQSDAS